MNDPSSASTPTWSGMDEPQVDLKMTRFKVVLLGEGAVGKSSILLRFVENKFNTEHFSTMQAAFATKQIFIDGETIELNIWDTAGQEKFHALSPIYYRDSQGAFLVYDITDANSFERVRNWVKELRYMLGDSATLIIIGNKIDLDENRVIKTTDAREYATSVGAIFYEGSAKDNVNINAAFEELTKAMLVKRRFQNAFALARRSSRRSLRVIDDTGERSSQRRKRCC